MVKPTRPGRPGGGLVESQGGTLDFKCQGIIEWGQKSKPKKFPRASNKNQKLTPKNTHAEFQSLKHFQKGFKNDITRKKKHKKLNVCVCLFVIPSEFLFSPHGGHCNNT